MASGFGCSARLAVGGFLTSLDALVFTLGKLRACRLVIGLSGPIRKPRACRGLAGGCTAGCLGERRSPAVSVTYRSLASLVPDSGHGTDRVNATRPPLPAHPTTPPTRLPSRLVRFTHSSTVRASSDKPSLGALATTSRRRARTRRAGSRHRTGNGGDGLPHRARGACAVRGRVGRAAGGCGPASGSAATRERAVRSRCGFPDAKQRAWSRC